MIRTKIIIFLLMIIILAMSSFNIFSGIAKKNAIKDSNIESFVFGYGSWNTIHTTFSITRESGGIVMGISNSINSIDQENYNISAETLKEIEKL